MLQKNWDIWANFNIYLLKVVSKGGRLVQDSYCVVLSSHLYQWDSGASKGFCLDTIRSWRKCIRLNDVSAWWWSPWRKLFNTTWFPHKTSSCSLRPLESASLASGILWRKRWNKHRLKIIWLSGPRKGSLYIATCTRSDRLMCLKSFWKHPTTTRTFCAT